MDISEVAIKSYCYLHYLIEFPGGLDEPLSSSDSLANKVARQEKGR